MQEAECRFSAIVETCPVVPSCFQERVGADDIGLDEGGGAVDGAIDVGFGGKMDDGIRSFGRDDGEKLASVANVS